MKKVILSIAVVVLCAVLYTPVISYVGKVKENTLQRKVKRPILSDELPSGFDSAYVEKMAALGMNTTKEALLLENTKRRKYWQETFGLTFMGDDEMQTFLKDNDFLLGEAKRYKFIVPIEAGKEIITNIEKIKAKEPVIYTWWQTEFNTTYYSLKREDLLKVPELGKDFNCYTHEYMDGILKPETIKKYGMRVNFFSNLKREPPIPKNIFIIGNKKDFNTEGLIIDENILTEPPPKDPIAVLKVPNGYVELANWE